MVVLNRRAFMAVTAAGVVAPTVIAAKEVVANMYGLDDHVAGGTQLGF